MIKNFFLCVGLTVAIILFAVHEAKSVDFIDSGQRLGNSAGVSAALGDLDGDGDLDAFVGNFASPNEIWLNDGDGVFSDSGQHPGSNAFSVALGDLDGDGDLDAFCANIGVALIFGAPDTVYMNNGAGVFTDSGQRLGNLPSTSVALGDLDGDGDMDAFVTSFSGPNKVWLNNGAGVFLDSGQSLVAGVGPGMSVALGDLDGDGDLDAFVGHDSSTGCRIWLNNGAGVLSDSGQSFGGSDNFSIALGDLDGDGDLDAFAGKWRNQPNKVFINDGSGSFSDSGQLLGSSNSTSAALWDLDQDGDLDAFIGNWSDTLGQPNQVYLNNGSGVFTDSGLSLGNASTKSVALGDLDGDGDLDAFCANDSGQANEVWLNITVPVSTTTVPPVSTTTTVSTTVVELSSFTATSDGNSILLEWETESEANNAGFNLYRAASDNGDYIKINSALIPAKGSSTQGAVYEFIDAAVQNLKTYYYQLEDIALEGTSTIHGPVHATVGSTATTTAPGSTTTTTASAGACAVETIYGERSAEVELLREYRDTVLSRSATGRRIISQYYELSPAVSEFLQKDPAARERARRVFDSMLPVLKNQLEHISSTILRGNRAEQ